jgi:hypothetical protein
LNFANANLQQQNTRIKNRVNFLQHCCVSLSLSTLMNSKLNWDFLGISASVACAIHCAILPLAISSLPIFGINVVNNVAFEYFMILLALAIGSFSLVHGYRRHHRNYIPVLLFVAGILLLFAKQLWHEYQFWLLPFAVIFIVSAHVRNFRLSRLTNCPDDEKSPIQAE